MLQSTTLEDKCFLITVFFVMLFTGFSIMPTGNVTAEELKAQKIRVSSLAVMPFLLGKRPENATSVMMCNMKSLCYEGDALAPAVGRTMTSILTQALTFRLGDKALTQADIESAYAGVMEARQEATPLDLAVALGKAVHVDYVVVGNIWRFRQRSGNAYASSQPASVAFNLHLVDVAGKSVVWKATFDKSQKALSDNLFQASEFFRQGAKWLTVEELAGFGVKELLKKFPSEGTK